MSKETMNKETASKEIEELKAKAPKLTLKELYKMIEDLTERVEKLEKKKGPRSTREMTEEDAKRVLFGDLKDKSHKEAAKELGLSYGQVYSCRSGYTFKTLREKSQNNK